MNECTNEPVEHHASHLSAKVLHLGIAGSHPCEMVTSRVVFLYGNRNSRNRIVCQLLTRVCHCEHADCSDKYFDDPV